VQDGIDRYRPDGAKRAYNVKELLGLVEPKDKEELREMIKELQSQLDENESWTDTANSILEVKPGLFGISLNLNELFARISAAKKRK
jgi:hypothetical protein